MNDLSYAHPTRRSGWWSAVALLTLLGCTLSSVPELDAGQEDTNSGLTVWDGIYTEDQASRGRPIYEANCSRCHGVDLNGLRAGPIKGDAFVEQWREFELEPLFTFIREEMPRDREVAVTLTEQDYLDIFSYILQENAFPTGTGELRTEHMPTIMLVGPNGPQPLQTGSLVVTTGCLERLSSTSWHLTHATEVRRTRNPSETTSEELTAARNQPLGPHTFGLQDIEYIADFSPREHEGTMVQAKGALVRQPNAERIQLYSLAPIESECVE